MGFNRSDVDFTPVTQIEDAKKGGKKIKSMDGGKPKARKSSVKGSSASEALKKAKAVGSKGVSMQSTPPKDFSVPASSNAAQKAAIKKQKLQ